MFGHNDDQSQPPISDNNPAAPAAEPEATPAATAPDQAWQHPGTPLENAATAPADNAIPANHTITPIDSTPPANDLLDIKQKALSQLSPIVGHLDQSPEEKFKTLMMMIQASDDQSLLQEAYDTAQKITDEKTKAQALLDVVNEINYFTQHKS